MPKHTREQHSDDREKVFLQLMAKDPSTSPGRNAPKVNSCVETFNYKLEERKFDNRVEKSADEISTNSKRCMDTIPSLPSTPKKYHNPLNMRRQGQRSINDRARTDAPDRRDRKGFEDGFQYPAIRPSFRLAGFAMSANCLHECCKSPLSADGVESSDVLPHEHDCSEAD
ncbi:hypothetical protein EDC01DRAFT_626573 [Geopyxis carbonaria]|nr:hypothetical protein EDC01DRAFT_626573 [Geopyxis carbonaria]